MRQPQVVVRLAFPTWALETKAVFLFGMSTRRYRNWECFKTGSLGPFSEEAPNCVLLQDYACSKISIVVVIHGSCNLIENIPFEIYNSLVTPGHVFWCQKGEHLPNCFALSQFYNSSDKHWWTLSVCSLCFGNKHAILRTNVNTPNNMICPSTEHHSAKFIW